MIMDARVNIKNRILGVLPRFAAVHSRKLRCQLDFEANEEQLTLYLSYGLTIFLKLRLKSGKPLQINSLSLK